MPAWCISSRARAPPGTPIRPARRSISSPASAGCRAPAVRCGKSAPAMCLVFARRETLAWRRSGHHHVPRGHHRNARRQICRMDGKSDRSAVSVRRPVEPTALDHRAVRISPAGDPRGNYDMERRGCNGTLRDCFVENAVFTDWAASMRPTQTEGENDPQYCQLLFCLQQRHRGGADAGDICARGQQI